MITSTFNWTHADMRFTAVTPARLRPWSVVIPTDFLAPFRPVRLIPVAVTL